MVKRPVILFTLFVTIFFSCAEKKIEDKQAGVKQDDSASVKEEKPEKENRQEAIEIVLPYSEEELRTLPREELMRDGGKIFYIVADLPVGEFCKKAQIFTEENGEIVSYLFILNNIIQDRLGTLMIDGSRYGPPFYAWKLERRKTGDGFRIYCYWQQGERPSTTDPLSFLYSSEEDRVYRWKPDFDNL